MNTIPRRSPEAIAAEAAMRGSDEKVPTAAANPMTVEGVKLWSRYGKAHELELMRRLILDLPPKMRSAVASIFCDSKATNCFDVELRDWRDRESLGAALATSLIDAIGGHNGIRLMAGGHEEILDADWDEQSDYSIWETGAGEKIPLTDMSTDHILRCILRIEKDGLWRRGYLDHFRHELRRRFGGRWPISL